MEDVESLPSTSAVDDRSTLRGSAPSLLCGSDGLLFPIDASSARCRDTEMLVETCHTNSPAEVLQAYNIDTDGYIGSLFPQ